MDTELQKKDEKTLYGEWHECSKEQPKTDGRYLVCMNNNYICTLNYELSTNYWSCLGYQSDVKYWMELPTPPKKE